MTQVIIVLESDIVEEEIAFLDFLYISKQQNVNFKHAIIFCHVVNSLQLFLIYISRHPRHRL
jgi:hypothetical protein